jgi:CRP-like cAMP-binding protein
LSHHPNCLLQALSQADFDIIRPHLEPVLLDRNDVCIEVDAPIEYVHFLEGGLGSTVIPDEHHGTAEVGMQGREGLIGVAVLLDADRSPHKVFMQAGGPAQRIRVAPLTEAMEQSASLRKILLRYAQVFLIQTGQTAYANARFDMKERLARWILMSADRLGPQLALTHEFLAYMLGVRRAGVTQMLHVLEGEQLIKSTRKNLIVLDRGGLEDAAGACYGVPEAEYERLIGPWR